MGRQRAFARVEERTSKAGLSLSSSSLSGLLQIDSLVAAVFVELGAPYLVRALMPGWTEADGCPQPHIEITHCFERFNQLLGVELPAGTFKPLQQQTARHAAFQRHVIPQHSGKVLGERSFVFENRGRVAVY